MRISPLLVAAAAGLTLAPSLATVAAAQGTAVAQTEPEAIPGELLVKFADDVPENRIDEINARFGVQVINRLLGGKLLQVRVSDPAAASDIMALYAATPGVLYAEPNFVQRGQGDGPGAGGPSVQF